MTPDTITPALENRNILLVISGGIAAYKALDLIRLLRRAGATVKCILTAGGAQFITPLSVGALSGQPVYTDLFSLKDETEMGHIRLSREADLIIVAPASAGLIARMAWGLTEDLAATVLLASDKPVIIAPAMNPFMWDNKATQDNVALLDGRGIMRVGPCAGDMACGETGIGRMAEPADILKEAAGFFSLRGSLAGRRALVTSGPTHEPIDPVRFIGNRSSGKQGHAIARALQCRGAAVTLVTGPVALPDPPGVTTVHVETAAEMLAACQAALPADIAVCAAAVGDWAPESVTADKIKKRAGEAPPAIALRENPDILATLSRPGPTRPALVVGFAAETRDLETQARDKRARKGCDWIVGNDVSGGQVFGADHNSVILVTGSGSAAWRGGKDEIAARLADGIAAHLAQETLSA